MSILGSIYCWFCRVCTYLQSPLLLLIRLFWGFKFMQAGWGKLMNLERTSAFLASLDIPWPDANAYLVGSVEFFGGILLMVGFLTRLAAFPLAITMIVAYVTAHKNALDKIATNPDLFTREAPFLFLYGTLVVLAFGAGFFSIDRWWKSRSNH